LAAIIKSWICKPNAQGSKPLWTPINGTIVNKKVAMVR